MSDVERPGPVKELAVLIRAAERQQMATLLDRNLDFERRSGAQLADGTWEVPALVSREQARELEDAGYSVEVGYELAAEAERARSEVSKTNRFEQGVDESVFTDADPYYMPREEVESYLRSLSNWAPELAWVFAMPELSHGEKQILGVHINSDVNTWNWTVMFTGGVHAREWGGVDANCWLIYRLINSYKRNEDLCLGNLRISASIIKLILENLNVVVVPLVNPDGRDYSMHSDTNPNQNTWWRKNRSPQGDGQFGVDINRNFDCAWEDHVGASSDKKDETYYGKKAHSEVETRNLAWLMHWYKDSLQFYMDVHSCGEQIMYSWGIDDNQSEDPKMNWRNPRFDGMRGHLDDKYDEYIDGGDSKILKGYAEYMQATLAQVRGKRYQVLQSARAYPTSATTDDYAYSRQLVDPNRARTYSFILEFGPKPQFVPPIREMGLIINDINAAQIAMLYSYAQHVAPKAAADATRLSDADLPASPDAGPAPFSPPPGPTNEPGSTPPPP